MSSPLIARFNNEPVLVAPDKANWLGECVRAAQVEVGKIENRMTVEPAKMQDDFWPAEGSWMRAFRPYNVTADGTLVIPIKGYMAHDFGYQIYDWVTGYTYIQKAFERGMADPMVKRIAMMVNSGGGDVAGNFDLVDRIFAMRGQKPIHAFVNEHSYSAAFSIATAAEKVYLPRTGGVGSVGVLTSHVNMSKALEKYGYEITLIHAGEHKVDGNPYEALPAPVKARIQKRIESMRQLFAETVARNLGMTVEAVLATEALTYSAADAIEVGFAHEIRPIDEALAAFSGELDPTEEEDTMELTPEQEKAVQERITAAQASAKAEGLKEGAAAERTRIQGVLTSEAAQGRSGLANHIAMGTDMTVDAAVKMLEASPKEAASTTAEKKDAPNGADFRAAMEKNNPNMTAENDGSNTTETAADPVAEFKAATGYGSEK